MIGYQFGAGPTTFRIFAGIEGENQDITPHDPNNSVQGSAVGLGLQAESWVDLSARSFISVDARQDVRTEWAT
ncbi:MAG: cellulose biosynthesis protein BcsS [Methyloceanibacter sp.]